MNNKKKLLAHINGFTLVESLLVLGIAALLFLITANIVGQIIPKNSVTFYSQTLLNDIRYQQLKAMTGQTEGQAAAQQFGIYIQPQSYTLFRGSSYNAAESSNLVVPVDTPSSLSTTFPNNTIIFQTGSGDISGFSGTYQTITISNSVTPETSVLTFNAYGVSL